MSESADRAIAAGPASGLSERSLIGLLGGLVLVAFLASLLVGPSDIGMAQGLRALFGSGSDRGEPAVLVMREIRLPRAILGLLIGAALGMSGAALQGYLRNPLAEPGIIGVTGGAALGAVLAIHSGLSAAFALALPLAGLGGGLLAIQVVLGMAGQGGGAVTLLLAGVAVTSLAGALTSLALNLSANPFATTEMVFWMLGSLGDRSLVHVWLAAPLILAGLALLAMAGRGLEALSLGEEVAASLGVELVRTRNQVVFGTALGVGAGTAVAGMIGFVGLIVPHLLRPLVGHRPGRLLVPSALGGAALVLVADTGLRLVPSFDLRLGVVTALIGAPFFLWLVARTRAELAP
jgi:iron complex transport system permease protein